MGYFGVHMHNVYLDNFRQNLEKQRTVMGIPQDKWADKLGLSLSAYKRFITGITEKIKFSMLPNLYYLTHKLLFEFCDISSKPLQLVQKLMQLSDQQLKFISDIVDFELKYKNSSLCSVIIPSGNMCDAMIYDSCNICKIDLPNEIKRRYSARIDFGIRVTSNHLHPVYHQGDILLIASRFPFNGENTIFINNKQHRAYLRKYVQGNPCRLVPITEFGEEITINPFDADDMLQWITLGTVITKLR